MPWPLAATSSQDPVAMFANDVMTVPASLAGLPAIAVPVSINPNGLPVGLQVIAGYGCEDDAIRVAAAIEDAADFSRLVPAHISGVC